MACTSDKYWSGEDDKSLDGDGTTLLWWSNSGPVDSGDPRGVWRWYAGAIAADLDPGDLQGHPDQKRRLAHYRTRWKAIVLIQDPVAQQGPLEVYPHGGPQVSAGKRKQARRQMYLWVNLPLTGGTMTGNIDNRAAGGGNSGYHYYGTTGGDQTMLLRRRQLTGCMEAWAQLAA